MTRTLVTVCFLVAFAAGFTIGLESKHREDPPKPHPSHGHDGWLTSQLNLSPEQQEQLRQIWMRTREGGQQREAQRQKLSLDRDQEIVDLIRPEDKGKYEAVLKKHADAIVALNQAWRKSFESAVEQTKQILTPEQRVKYEKLLQRGPGGWRHEHGEHGDQHMRNQPVHDQPATSPSA